MSRIVSLGIQYLDEEKFKTNGEVSLNKPWFGLYGSTMYKDTYLNRYFSSWAEFAEGENFYPIKYMKGISYTLHKNAKIYTVDSEEDYDKLLNKYSMINDMDRLEIDWNKFAKDYDAFHLTLDAFYEMRMPSFRGKFTKIRNGKEYRKSDFYSYDCETWIIFNLDCINKGSINNVYFNINPYRE